MYPPTISLQPNRAELWDTLLLQWISKQIETFALVCNYKSLIGQTEPHSSLEEGDRSRLLQECNLDWEKAEKLYQINL